VTAADRVIRWTTAGAVVSVAAVAAIASYEHAYALVALDLLRWAIAALPRDAGEIHLQLASLEYIDVTATRELVMLTTRPSRPRPVLHYPPLVMLRLLQLCSPR
jgi:hypothetical protein